MVVMMVVDGGDGMMISDGVMNIMWGFVHTLRGELILVGRALSNALPVSAATPVFNKTTHQQLECLQCKETCLTRQ